MTSNRKRSKPVSPAKDQTTDTRSSTPATKRTACETGMAQARVEGMLENIANGQQELRGDLTAFGQKLDGVSQNLAATLAGVQEHLQQFKTEVTNTTQELKSRVGAAEQLVEAQARELASLKELLGNKRKLDLTVQFPDSKCANKPMDYTRATLSEMGYTGPISNVRVGSFKAPTPKKDTDPPAGSAIWIVDFTVESQQAALDLRKKANDVIRSGQIRSLGLFRTKQERADELTIRKSAAFQAAVNAARARNEKIRWDYGKCYVGETEWTPAKALSPPGDRGASSSGATGMEA